MNSESTLLKGIVCLLYYAKILKMDCLWMLKKYCEMQKVLQKIQKLKRTKFTIVN